MTPSLVVFQDGKYYLDSAGQIRVTAVLDTMIHAGELPPTVAVFVMPAGFPEERSSLPQR